MGMFREQRELDERCAKTHNKILHNNYNTLYGIGAVDILEYKKTNEWTEFDENKFRKLVCGAYGIPYEKMFGSKKTNANDIII